MVYGELLFVMHMLKKLSKSLDELFQLLRIMGDV